MDDNERAEQPEQQFNTDYPGGTSPAPRWDAPPAVVPTRGPRMVPAVIAGIVAAIAAAVIWYLIVGMSGWQIGFLAIGVGFVIGYVMRFAAGGVGGLPLQIGAVVLTLLSMFTAEFLIARKFIGEYLVAQGDTQPLALLIPPADMFAIVSGVVREDMFTLLFWLIALSGAWRVTQATHEPQTAAAPTDTLPA